MTPKPCTHEYLANTKSGKVLICRDCGVVHLHLQNMSLRLDVEQFAAFAALMTEASKRMRDETSASTDVRPRLRLVH